MMLAPLRTNRGRAPVAVSRSRGAPVKGWNARDSLAAMKPDYAVLLKNWFPETGHCAVRRGHIKHATDLPSAPVESLMNWASGPTHRLLAACDGAIYNVTASGSVGAPLASGFASDRWQSVNFGTSGGHFLVMVSGADDPQVYDGSTVSTTVISASGLVPANLINVCVHQRRLFFVEDGTLTFWYLDAEAITGTASSFDLAPLLAKGGQLMAMGTWTRDGGDGPDDLIAFISSEGQVAVYAGTNPDSADSWGLVGVFDIGRPLGRRCALKIGADLVIMTVDGFVPMSLVLPTGRAQPEIALTKMISHAVSDVTRLRGGSFGWQPLLYPRGHMAIFNVPTREGRTQEQYVMNTITGAWCRFTGMNAACWALMNDELFFGGNAGTVYKADTGASDDGANIEADVLTAFDYFGSPGRQKQFTMVQPIIVSDGLIQVALEVQVDFEDRLPTATPTFSAASTAEWDVAQWDEAQWAGEQLSKSWQSVTGVGFCGALRMRAFTNAVNLRWHATNYLFQPGGYL